MLLSADTNPTTTRVRLPQKNRRGMRFMASPTSCHAEVAKLRHAAPLPVVEQKDVGRLDVSVADLQFVHVAQPGCDLLQAPAHLVKNPSTWCTL